MSPRADPPLEGFFLDLPVRFSECDAYGVVWHGRYAVYLEELRNAVTARYGWTVATARAKGYLVPVTRLEISYRAPARLDTAMRVTGRLRRPDVPRLTFDYEIRDAGSGLLLTRASTEQVVTRESGELLVALPEFLRSLVGEILTGQDDPAHRDLRGSAPRL